MIDQVEPLIPALRRYAATLLRDRSGADDLVQDCLERALTRWNQRRSEGSVRAWMFTILHNLAINQMRQVKRRGAVVDLDDVDEAAMGERPVQEDRIRSQDILDLIAGLPEDQRSVLLLVAVEDFSYAEVATMLDIPLGTVMSRLSRAREKMRLGIDSEAPPIERPRPMLRRVK